MMDMIEAIEGWAKERGLDKSDSNKQLIKLVEEVGELSEAHNKGWEAERADSLGDMFVVMVIYAMQNNLHMEYCIDEAYETIKSRKGKTVNGVFIKDEDLEKAE